MLLSGLWSIEFKDFIRGTVSFVLSSILDVLYQAISTNTFNNINLKYMLLVGSAAFIASIIKAFGTDNNGKVLGKV